MVVERDKEVLLRVCRQGSHWFVESDLNKESVIKVLEIILRDLKEQE